MENRIDQVFSTLRARGEKAFIAYFCAGDPDLAATPLIGAALAEAGVDLLELGVPFSDPLADGAVNQMASQRALDAGATLPGVLGAVRELRKRSEVPVVLYTYLNPLYSYGFERFHQDAAAAGVDGMLILDLPPEEEGEELGTTHGIRRIRLVAPTTPPKRVSQIVRNAEGFIYYVSREGVTGEQTALADSIGERVARIRAETPLPIAVGFGISTPEQAAEVARSGDAVVVGSAIVRRIAEHAADPDLPAKVAEFVRPMVEAAKREPHRKSGV